MNTIHDLLKCPASFRLPWSRFLNAPDWQRAEVVATKFDGDNAVAWAVREGGSVLAKDGEWECEPLPSSRDEEFFHRCRWDSANLAAQAAAKYFDK